jgi:hypothetical protein
LLVLPPPQIVRSWRNSRRRTVMAKGQQRSNKEKRKPKQNKDDKKGAKK